MKESHFGLISMVYPPTPVNVALLKTLSFSESRPHLFSGGSLMLEKLREEKFALKEGDVRMTYPENMSIESIEDLEAYLQVFFNKARREAGRA
jgi:hypothetical protein